MTSRGRVVRANFARLRACYDFARKSDPALKGTVSFNLTIDSTGAVSTASATAGTLKNAPTVSCIARVIRTLSFPEPEGGIVSASFTHQYSPPP